MEEIIRGFIEEFKSYIEEENNLKLTIRSLSLSMQIFIGADETLEQTKQRADTTWVCSVRTNPHMTEQVLRLQQGTQPNRARNVNSRALC